MTVPNGPDDASDEGGVADAGGKLLMIVVAVFFVLLIMCTGCCGFLLAINYAIAD